MNSDQVDVEALRERLMNWLRHSYWYETEWHGHAFPVYTFLAECWPHPQLRVEILHRMADWDKARRKAFIQCIEEYLPKEPSVKHVLVPRAQNFIGDPEGEGASWSAGPESSIFWDEVPVNERPMVYGKATNVTKPSDGRIGVVLEGDTVQKNPDGTKSILGENTIRGPFDIVFDGKTMERWKAHPASGGGEVPQNDENTATFDASTSMSVSDDFGGGVVEMPASIDTETESEPSEDVPFTDLWTAFHSFLAHKCVLEDGAETPFADLWTAFRWYASAHGLEFKDRPTFGSYLGSLGLERYRIKKTGLTGYRGIRLREDGEAS